MAQPPEATPASASAKTEDPSAGAARKTTDPKSLKRFWLTVTGTVVVTSGIWTFFHVRVLELKDEQIKVLQARAHDAKVAEGVPRRLDHLEARLGFVQRLLQVDPLDGRWSLGGISGPSDLTNMLSEAEAKAKARDFDGALDLARRMEEIYPDFAGAAFIRFLVDSAKGYDQPATEDARKAVTLAPKDKRLLPLYLFLVDSRLKHDDKQDAENYARLALQLAPEEKGLAERFKQLFGFLPSAKP
jgi:tetratricopeptide (TPR) repeat protein